MDGDRPEPHEPRARAEGVAAFRPPLRAPSVASMLRDAAKEGALHDLRRSDGPPRARRRVAQVGSGSGRAVRSPWPDPRRLAAALLALVMTVSALVPERTRAQERELSPQEERWRDADLGDDLYFAASNAVVSGVAAAVIAAFRDHVSVREAFLGG